MCNDTTREAKTIVDNIKKMLLNLELTVAYADGEIALRKATMELHEGKKNKYSQRKFIEAKIDKERYEIFKEDIEHQKNDILENVDCILSKYNKRYKQIFMLCFFQDKSRKEIAEITHYSKEAIDKIIQKFRTDLLTFYSSND